MAVLDLGVGPVADAGGLARGDVARLHHAPRPGEFGAALAQRAGEIPRPAAGLERRVALHAVADGGEIEAALQLVVEIGRRIGLLGAGKRMVRQRDLVDRVGHLVLDRLEWCADRRRWRRDRRASGSGRTPSASPRRPARRSVFLPVSSIVLICVVGPGADAGVLVLRDVRRGHLERRLVPVKARRRNPCRRSPAADLSANGSCAQVMMVLTR